MLIQPEHRCTKDCYEGILSRRNTRRSRVTIQPFCL